MQRSLTTVLLTGLLLVLGALPAAADPAGPTSYASRVTSVEPPHEAVEVDVLGGDAFVEVRVASGATAEVAGYDGEPYLRFGAGGTVERNEFSPTRWLNDARYGAAETTVPPEASAGAQPRWEVVATGGVFAWHDHRVHWMSPELPPNVDAGAGDVQRVTTWELPLTVDGDEVLVTGELDWLPPASPLPATAVVLLVLAAGVALSLRRPDRVLVVTVLGAVAALSVGVAGTVGLPPGADADPALLVLPSVTLAVTGVALATHRRGGLGPQLLAACAGLPLLIWSLLLIRAVTAPVVPTALPDLVARLLVATALGAGLASVVAAGRAVLTPAPVPASDRSDAAPAAG